jgi:CheY-like chemotaxis protein
MVAIVLFSIFLNLVTCLSLSIFLIFTKNKYKSFTLFNMNLVMWSLFYALSITAETPEKSLLYNRLCSFFIVFIPYLAFNFCTELANYKVKKSLKNFNLICAILLGALMFTPLLIKSVKPYLSFKFIPDITLAYYLLPLYYTINVVCGHIILYKAIKTDIKNRFIFIGFVIGFSGGTTNLFPYMGIPVYPLGNFLISVYCPLIAYAIIKHRLFDISVVISEGITRLLTLITIGASYFILTFIYHKLIPDSNSVTDNIFYISFLLAAFESYNFLMKKFHSTVHDHIITANSYRYESLLKKLNQELINAAEIDNLWLELNKIFDQEVKMKIKTFAIIKEINSPITNKEKNNLEFFGENILDILTEDFYNHFQNLQLSITDKESPSWLQPVFDHYNKPSSFIPFIAEHKVIGFMLIEKNAGTNYFSYNDLVLFDNLTFQIGIIIDRIKVYQEISLQKQKFLEEKAKSLKSLAGTIAHEMRNPLNSIINALDYIRISLPNRPNPDSTANIEYKIDKDNLTEIYNTIDQSGTIITRGNKIIDSILANMRGEGIEINKFTRISAVKEIKNAINDFGYKNIEDKKLIETNLSQDFEFFGDRDLFIYIIFNLIKNSLYYKDKEGFKIKIRTEQGFSQNTVIIKDYGPGIPEEKLPTLFKSFMTSGKEGGTGLGLSFCKRTMTSFEGNIECNSKLGEWTEFKLTFPLYSSSEIREIQHKVLKQKRILIVDDDEISYLTIKQFISDSVQVVDLAIDGKEALEMIAANQYDLILMDIEMPIMNGYEATKIIRTGNSTNITKSIVVNYNKVPIIAITSLDANISKERALFFGMNDFIHKPFTRDIINNIIDKWFFEEKLEENPRSLNNLSRYALGKTILITDDEETNLKFTGRFLENFGFKVQRAANGEQAINILDQENCDLILMDTQMPIMNGFEAAKSIRKGEVFKNFKNFKRIPILALTGDNSEEALVKALEHGMNDLISKPISPSALVDVVKNYLI